MASLERLSKHKELLVRILVIVIVHWMFICNFSLSFFAVICSSFQTAAPETLAPFVNQLSNQLLPYLTPRDPVDPLSAEKRYVAPPGILNLTTTERTPVDWFLNIIYSPFVNAAFVNDLITGLLSEDGAIRFSADAFGTLGKLTLPTDFANVTVTFVGLSAFGLNSFTDVGERTFYGNYTFGAPFRLEYIYTEVDLIIEILPLSSNTIEFDSQEVIVENVRLSFNATDINGFFSMFLAIVTDELALVPPTALFGSAPFDCLFPTFDWLEITQLETIKSVSTPILSNFSSAGTARLANGWEEALWLKYEDSIYLAMPNIMQETIRPLVNTNFLEPQLMSANFSNCPGVVIPEGSVAETSTPEYGSSANNANGFIPGGKKDPPYGSVAGNVNGYSYGEVSDSLLRWDPLARLTMPSIIPRASFFRKQTDRT
jgi:hypothetical protein